MPAHTLFAKPLPVLTGIDRSAWISGLSYAAGLLLAGREAVATAMDNAAPALSLLAAAFVVFIAVVLAIQRHMRLSLLANTFGAPQRLVTGGVFAYSRNPIYVAFFVPIGSLAVLSPAAAVASGAIYFLGMTALVISKEERDLRTAFGAEFTEYAAHVPRWFI